MEISNISGKDIICHADEALMGSALLSKVSRNHVSVLEDSFYSGRGGDMGKYACLTICFIECLIARRDIVTRGPEWFFVAKKASACEAGKAMDVIFDPSRVMTLAKSGRYGKDAHEMCCRTTNLLELYSAFCNRVCQEEQERESKRHGTPEPADPPRKAYPNQKPATSSKDTQNDSKTDKPPGNWKEPSWGYNWGHSKQQYWNHGGANIG